MVLVTTLADTVNPNDGVTSLREAISSVPNGGTITFDPRLNNRTIALSGTQLTINKSLTINGNIIGVGDQTADITINGQGNSRIFYINDGNNFNFSNVVISGLKLINGKVTGTDTGGGIYNWENLSLSNSNISGNSAYHGGGVYSSQGSASFSNTIISGNSAYRGGGVYHRFGSASFSNTTISGNLASFNGGGVYSYIGASFSNTTISGNTADAGGGVYSDGSASFSNTTISGNTAGDGGGVNIYSGYASFSNTTISGNSASFNGGGVRNRFGYASFSNTTISGNTAYSRGGGVHNTGGASASFSNTTISGNTAHSFLGFGGGGVSNGGEATFTSTIVSGNQNEDLRNFNTIISNGHNLVGIGDTESFNQTTDQTNITNPRLGPLADNGGPTLTHAILADSPAIDAGSNPDDLLYDQRGADFLRTKGTATDIGAFESDFYNIKVTTLADVVNPNDEVTSLREAISSVPNGGTITFAASLNNGTITLSGTQLTINKSLTINGNIIGVGDQTADITINGQGNSRIFYIDDGNNSSLSNVVISGLKLINGRVTGLTDQGGGIFNRENLSLSNSNISGNSASSGAGVFSRDGSASFSNTIISGNSASFGGGVHNTLDAYASFNNTTISGNSAYQGGGVYSDGSASFSNTTISGNSAREGGGVYSDGSASFSNTTISGNSARDGGGVYNRFGNASFSNTTISGNSARDGGGVNIHLGGASFSNTTISGNSARDGGGVNIRGRFGYASFSNTTISGNSASVGGGVNNGGEVTFTSTIVSGNQNEDLRNFDTIISNGHNLVGTGNTESFNQTTDQTNITNPRLGPLADNGGPTLTHAILAGSPAIDRGSNPLNLQFDQRGQGFPRTKGTATDIGAFESDFILGTSKRDNLIGTSGNDVIIGLTSRDTLTGNGGNDIFVYNRLTDAGDIITDFTPTEDLLDFNGVMQSIGYIKSNPINDGYITFSQSGSNTLVNIDADGPNPPGIAPPRAFILLQNVQPSALGIDNFIPFG